MGSMETFEIFSWLPAKSLLKFRSVSKDCAELLSDKYFLMKQSLNSKRKEDVGFIIQQGTCETYSPEAVEFHSLDNNSTLQVPRESVDFIMKNGRILASSNGLLLCRNTRGELFLCNPATKEWLSIPIADVLLKEDYNIVVFECNYDMKKFPHDYLLMFIVEIGVWSDLFNCKVYSPGEGVWKEGGRFNSGGRNIRFDMPVFLNGAVHFVSECGPYNKIDAYIVSYNVEKGYSRTFNLPWKARKLGESGPCSVGLFKWVDRHRSLETLCLVLLRKGVFAVWILEDYDSEIWTQILNMKTKQMGVKEPDAGVSGCTVIYRNGNCLVFTVAGTVYSYSLMGKGNQKVEQICRHNYKGAISFYSYSGTLHPCGKGSRQIPNDSNKIMWEIDPERS